jgi:hypothetical protein
MIKPPRLTYGGAAHCALRYATMKKKSVTAEEMLTMFPHKFRNLSRVKEVMVMLAKYQLLTTTPTGWKINYFGSEYLRVTAKGYRGD